MITMKKHWKFTKHFAERFIQRFNGSRKEVDPIKSYFDQNVLQCVFNCHLYGGPQRVKVGKYKVCYKYDDTSKQIIVTTIY